VLKTTTRGAINRCRCGSIGFGRFVLVASTVFCLARLRAWGVLANWIASWNCSWFRMWVAGRLYIWVLTVGRRSGSPQMA